MSVMQPVMVVMTMMGTTMDHVKGRKQVIFYHDTWRPSSLNVHHHLMVELRR